LSFQNRREQSDDANATPLSRDDIDRLLAYFRVLLEWDGRVKRASVVAASRWSGAQELQSHRDDSSTRADAQVSTDCYSDAESAFEPLVADRMGGGTEPRKSPRKAT
jgi:hypothetical protein